MKQKIVLIAVVCALSGCTNAYQRQVDQTLLLQENRRLEDALYVTHAQLVELKRENEALRGVQGKPSTSSPIIRPKKAEFAPRDDYEDAPPFEPPKVDIPSGAPGTNALPDALKSSRAFPKPSPPKKLQNETAPENTDFPELTLPSADEPTFPNWAPTR